MLLTDRQAVRLIEFLDRYVQDCVVEGQSSDEVGDLTIRMLLNDLIGSLPAHATVELPPNVRAITGD